MPSGLDYERPVLSDTPKEPRQHNTTYQPIRLSPAKVYELAQHHYTLEEICEAFSITKITLIKDEELHAAFKAGKEDAKSFPRFMLRKVINDFAMKEDLADPKCPTHNLLKALELWARKHENLVDKVIEKPSVSDIKFKPLQSDD